MSYKVLLRLPEVKDATGLSAPTIYRRIADGTFPRPRKAGPGATGWLPGELEHWAASLPETDDPKDAIARRRDMQRIAPTAVEGLET